LKNSRTTQGRYKQRVEQPETKKSASTIVEGRKDPSFRDASKLYDTQHRSRFDDHSGAEVQRDVRCNRSIRDKENRQPLSHRRSKDDRNSSVDTDRVVNKKHFVCPQMSKQHESGFHGDGDFHQLKE